MVTLAMFFALAACAGSSSGSSDAATPATPATSATSATSVDTLAPLDTGIVPEGFATITAHLTEPDGSSCTRCLLLADTPALRAQIETPYGVKDLT